MKGNFFQTIISIPINENKYPRPSSETVTRGEEEGIADRDVLAFGEVVGLDSSL